MTSSPVRKLCALVVCGALSALLVACGGNPPRSGPAPSARSIATFKLPARAGDLSLDRTHAFEDPAYGVQYTYGIQAGEPIDVYIYPIAYEHRLDSAVELDRALDLLLEEFAYGMDQAITAKIYSAATLDEDARIEVTHGAKCLPGRYRRMLLEKDGVTFASEMYGFAAYGSYIKLRASRPVDTYSAARNRAFVDAFMLALDEDLNLFVSDPSDPAGLVAGMTRIARVTPAACTPAPR